MKHYISNLLGSDTFLYIKGALVLLIGPLNNQIGYLLLAIVIDLFFGIQVARKEKQFSWGMLFIKVRRKLLIYILWITMFHAFDMVTGLPNTARWAVVAMLASMEIFSAIKNTAKLGYTKLADSLEQIFLSLIRQQEAQQEIQQELQQVEKVAEEIKILEGSAETHEIHKHKHKSK